MGPNNSFSVTISSLYNTAPNTWFHSFTIIKTTTVYKSWLGKDYRFQIHKISFFPRLRHSYPCTTFLPSQCNRGDTGTRKLHWCTWQKLCSLIGRQCLKVSGTRNFHGIELRSIRHKFLVKVSQVCATPVSENTEWWYGYRNAASWSTPWAIKKVPLLFLR